MAKAQALPVKETATTRKVNVRLMDENMTLKTQVQEQLKLILSMRSRKEKAYRRLKALRELSKHVTMLQMQNSALHAEISAMRWRDEALANARWKRQQQKRGFLGRLIFGGN